jgi:hypothetical protein
MNCCMHVVTHRSELLSVIRLEDFRESEIPKDVSQLLGNQGSQLLRQWAQPTEAATRKHDDSARSNGLGWSVRAWATASNHSPGEVVDRNHYPVMVGVRHILHID